MGEESTSKALTPRQRRFVDLYLGECVGNGVQAARQAGYVGSDETLRATAYRQLTKAHIRAEIDRVQAQSPLIATRDERLQTLTKILRAEGTESTKDRLKALDQLSKISGDYVQRVEVSGPDGSAIKSEAKLDVSKIDDALLDHLLSQSKKG